MTYTLDDKLKVGNLPAQHNAKDSFGTYDSIGEKNDDGDMIQLRRTLTINTSLLQAGPNYQSLRRFFGTVMLGDQEPAVLEIVSNPKTAVSLPQ